MGVAGAYDDIYTRSQPSTLMFPTLLTHQKIIISLYLAVLHTENVAREGKLSFQNLGGGGAKVYTMYSLFKSLGGGQELT